MQNHHSTDQVRAPMCGHHLPRSRIVLPGCSTSAVHSVEDTSSDKASLRHTVELVQEEHGG